MSSATHSSMTADRLFALKQQQQHDAGVPLLRRPILEGHHVGPATASDSELSTTSTHPLPQTPTGEQPQQQQEQQNSRRRAPATRPKTARPQLAPATITTVASAPTAAAASTRSSTASLARSPSSRKITKPRTAGSTSTIRGSRTASTRSSKQHLSATPSAPRVDSAIALKSRPQSAALHAASATSLFRPQNPNTSQQLPIKLVKRKPEPPRKPLSSDERTLLDACEGNDLDTVYATLWTKRPDINCRKPLFGSTPLAVACRTGNKRIAAILLSFGADLGAGDEYGASPLHWAATSGSSNLVSLLLQTAHAKGHVKPVLASLPTPPSPSLPPPPPAHPPNVPNVLATRDAFGSTALHFASVLNMSDVARLLIQAGADPTAKNNDGRVPSDLTTDDSLKAFLQESESRLRTHIAAYARVRKRQAAAAAQAAAATASSRPGSRTVPSSGKAAGVRPGSSIARRAQ